jgi:hypothetical protein
MARDCGSPAGHRRWINNPPGKQIMFLRQFLFGLALGMPAVPSPPQNAAQLPERPGLHREISAAEVCGGGKSYDQITGEWRLSKPGRFPQATAQTELTIQTTEFADPPVIPPNPFHLTLAQSVSRPDFCDWNMLSVGVDVSAIGEMNHFANGEGAMRGGSGSLTPEALLRLESLMSELPDDGHRVPPPTRRVVVAMWRSGAQIVRLYDSANPPASLIEMIRLTAARIKTETPAPGTEHY